MDRNSFLRKPLGFEGKFTQFPNSWARDNRIGFRAKGLLTLLMSHTDGWRISMQSIATTTPDGITAIRTAVQELEDAGYLTRTLVRNDKSQVEGSEWILADPFEEPVVESENPIGEKVFTLENLMSENLMSGNLISENLTLKNTNIKEHNNKENNMSSSFEAFWGVYPRKIGKGAARVAFEKAIKKASPITILAMAGAYANKPDLPDLQFIPHPATWLNQERWTDDLNAAGVSNATSIASDILTRGKALQERVEGNRQIES